MRALLFVLALLGAPALQAQTATLSWTAPTLNTDGSPITALPLTYNVLQATASGTPATCGAFTVVASKVSGLSTTLTLPAADIGTTQCWELVTIDANNTQSAPTNPVLAAISAPTPNPPSSVVVVIR